MMIMRMMYEILVKRENSNSYW